LNIHWYRIAWIAKERHILVCAPDHQLTKVNPLSVIDLQSERVIIYSRTLFTTKMIDKYLQKHGLMGYKSVEINKVGWVKMMLKKGLGIAFLPKSLVYADLQKRELIGLHIRDAPPAVPVYLIYNSMLPVDIVETITNTSKGLFEQP
jgi:DNA-binding transcriptional LysR family regulator